MIVGILAWLLLEYTAHRALHVFKNRRHARHHENRIPERAGTACLLVCAAGAVGGPGFAAGAGAYVVVHTVVHRWGGWLPTLAEHHKRHHNEEGGNFGVTCTWLDTILGTQLN